jgi:hypothetical protein
VNGWIGFNWHRIESSDRCYEHSNEHVWFVKEWGMSLPAERLSTFQENLHRGVSVEAEIDM